jgi:CubicO group peptidase (beta-lactamase class C family)
MVSDRATVPAAFVERWVRDGDASAVAATVVTADGVREECYAGEARPDTLFALASLTKPLLALAVLLAVEEGVLELDRPVAADLPDHPRGWPEQVTPRHLLAHASGLPESGPPGVPPLELELAAQPATRRIYSNEGYVLLGALLDAATGMSYRDYVREAVFEPLGMDARLGLDERDAARTATVREPGLYRPGVALFNSRRWRERASPAGGAFATLAAYAEVVRLLLARGTPLLHEDTWQELRSVQFPGLAGGVESFMTWERADWGLGPELRDAKTPHWTGMRNSPATFGHFGLSGTFLWVDPEAGIALACLTDLEFGDWAKEAWPRLSDDVLAEAGR